MSNLKRRVKKLELVSPDNEFNGLSWDKLVEMVDNTTDIDRKMKILRALGYDTTAPGLRAFFAGGA